MGFAKYMEDNTRITEERLNGRESYLSSYARTYISDSVSTKQAYNTYLYNIYRKQDTYKESRP